MTGIICAMELEAKNIRAEMTSVTEEIVSGVHFFSGRLGNRDAVVAVCGIGKVFAALCAEAMILRYSPSEIVNAGVAGALDPSLRVFDTLLASNVVQHDMNTVALGDEPGLISGINLVALPADTGLNARLCRAAEACGINVREARIASGDRFVATEAERAEIRRGFNAAACEMEGGAIAQVCYVNGLPFALLRTISDAQCDNYAVFAERAADISASIILRFFGL